MRHARETGIATGIHEALRRLQGDALEVRLSAAQVAGPPLTPLPSGCDTWQVRLSAADVDVVDAILTAVTQVGNTTDLP
jgi:hypothetical protein